MATLPLTVGGGRFSVRQRIGGGACGDVYAGVDTSCGAAVAIKLEKSGDTLSKIAKEHYGDPNQYKKIFEANREVIGDPDKIYPGQQIRIPA